jgi:hypothetical protein
MAFARPPQQETPNGTNLFSQLAKGELLDELFAFLLRLDPRIRKE